METLEKPAPGETSVAPPPLQHHEGEDADDAEKLSRKFSTTSLCSTENNDDDEPEDDEEDDKNLQVPLGPQVPLKEQLEMDKVWLLVFLLLLLLLIFFFWINLGLMRLIGFFRMMRAWGGGRNSCLGVLISLMLEVIFHFILFFLVILCFFFLGLIWICFDFLYMNVLVYLKEKFGMLICSLNISILTETIVLHCSGMLWSI